MRIVFNKKDLTKFGVTNSIILALIFSFFTFQILLTNVNAEPVANLTINQTAAIAPLNSIQLNFSVYSNNTAATWRGNLTNVTIVFQPIADGSTLLNVSGGTSTSTAGYGTRLLNATTLNFFNGTSSPDLFTDYAQRLDFLVNVTAIESGNYTIFINTTYNSTKLGNSTTVWLNVVNGTITLTNATFSNFTYNGRTITMNFTGIASSPTGGGSVNDNITFLLYRNTSWKSTNYSSGGIGTFNYTNATADTYLFVFNTTGTNNYTSTSLAAVLNISKAVPTLTTFIAGLLGNSTVTYPTSVQILGNVTYGNSTPIPEPTSNIYVANVTPSATPVLITSSGNPVTITNTYGNGTYQIIYNTTGSVNFTSAQNITAFLLVNKGNLANYLDVSIDNSYANTTVNYPYTDTVFGRSNYTGASDITLLLFKNDTDVTSAENNTAVQRAIGSYNFIYGTVNPTAANWTVGNSTLRTLIIAYVAPAAVASVSTSGGGTTISITKGFVQIITTASPTEPAIADVSPDKSNELKVDEVKVDLKDTVNNAQIAVKESSIPSGANAAVSTDQGATYKYLEISTTIQSTKIDKVTVKFKVEKSWLSNNTIDYTTISLQRYANSQWNKLNTTFINEDSTYYYFEAVSPGFSIFSITGLKGTPTTPTQQCPACDSCTAWSDCLANNQTRTCYKCDVSTAYKCQSYSETKDCTPVIGQAVKTTWQTIVAWVVVIGGLIVIIWLLVKRRKPAKAHHTNHE